MGGTDQLICGMAIWLTRLLGQERLYVFTADYRMYKVLEKVHKITPKQMETWGIVEMAERNIGFEWSADFFPRSVLLPQASDKQLRDIFGSWPLPTRKKRSLKHPRSVKESEVETLLELYKAIGVGRDRLPYSPKIKLLTRQFNDSTGHSLSEAEIWSFLISRLKKGGGKLNR